LKKQSLLSFLVSFLLLSSTLFSSINPSSYLEKPNELSQTVYGLYGGAGGLSTYQLLNLEEPVTSAAMAIPLANIGKGEVVVNGVKVGSGVTEAGSTIKTGSVIDNYIPPKGGGGITSTIETNGQTVTFGHGARHLEGTNLDINTVNKALAADISKAQIGVGQSRTGQIVVNGVTVEYKAYGVKDGVVNIGTYYPIP
jgi:hypothetical protein